MRIDRLTVQNFKKFPEQTFSFHPRFTLLVGDNGAGKTSVLDALAVSLGIWLVKAPDTSLVNSRRNILPQEIRLASSLEGDRLQFRQCRPVAVQATGAIDGRNNLTWTRQITSEGKITNNAEAKEALAVIAEMYARNARGERLVCPVVAYYGAGRAWLPSNARATGEVRGGPARRWAAFYDCFNERVRFAELTDWFKREAIAAVNRGGHMRPGFEVVRRAILRCVPEADNVWFDGDREEIVLSMAGHAQPASNLSAGQRMMLGRVADIAIKIVTQNAFLLPPDRIEADDQPVPRVFQETPGVVLIDELDVHLHPTWQRRVATDLKEMFPAIQFVCTSHSPQVIGELTSEEIRLLEDDTVTIPHNTLGVDSDRILEELMGARSRNEAVETALHELFDMIDREDFQAARDRLAEVEAQLGTDDPEVSRARVLMSFLEDSSLSRNPALPAHQVERFIQYLGDGSITSDDAAFDAELNGEGSHGPDGKPPPEYLKRGALNLNLPFLRNNRKAVLEAFKRGLEKRGTLEKNVLERMLRKWDGTDSHELLEPYCQVVVYWLQKRLKSASKSGSMGR